MNSLTEQSLEQALVDLAEVDDAKTPWPPKSIHFTDDQLVNFFGWIRGESGAAIKPLAAAIAYHSRYTR